MQTLAGEEGLSAPQPLADRHDLTEFDCGEAALNDWLRRRARANQVAGASRSFVVCQGPVRVVGFYSLSVCSVPHARAISVIRRNMPDPVPMMLLGRLAVDLGWHGRGIGSGMLKDAVIRTAQVSEHAGVRGLLVHAISDGAKRFYARWGLSESPVDPMTLMVRLADIVATVRASG